MTGSVRAVAGRGVVAAALAAGIACHGTPRPQTGSSVADADANTSGGADANASVEAGASADANADADANASGAADADVKADAGPVAAEARDAGPAPEDMLLVEGGTFTMGSDTGGEGDEKPAHAVTVASFWLDRTEVTQSAYALCVKAKQCPPPDPAILDSFGGGFKGPNKPVIGITWFAARDYCKWRAKRLPREAEFERAVRGTDGRRYPWGMDPPSHERTVYETNTTEDVATHPSGRGPYGHHDLAGNVWEWIEDDYDPLAYTRAGAAEGKPGSCDEIVAAQNKLRAENKQGFTGSNPIPTECEKAIRGGAYNYPAGGLRSTNRIHHPPSFKLRMTGVRCAKDT